ncbi:oligosaccharide flippase family protein [Calothrix rhizosoleniae]|uniref:oligosaccharide flippase family protein n=1 Tax=Calothrix rhizosoleniae TaxID=888997 RepID=UPI000B49FFF6|nr:oligosaccharide flippase family protein [Calothrix rhizosoleniae]
MSSNTFKQRAIRATIWTLIEQFGGHIIRFGSNLILTRLLVPEYFSLMALINTFISGLEMFSDVGVAPSVIQNKHGDNPVFFNTAWTIQVMRGLGLWLASILIAWPIAIYYQQQRMLWLIPIAGLNALLASLQSTSIFTLKRNLELSRLSKFGMLGYLYKTIIIIFWAWLNPTIWAIVGGSLISGFIDIFRSHKLIPQISNRFTWDKNAAKDILSFGKWIFISTAMTFLAMQSDRLILGKLAFPMLAFYSIALALAEMPKQTIAGISGNVMFPIVAKFQDLPRKQLREKILQKRWLLVVGMALGLSVIVCFGDILILTLYDRRYNDAAWMLPILSLGTWPALLEMTMSSSLIAIGKPMYSASGNFFKFIYMIIGVPLGFSLLGILGAVIVIAFNDLPIYITINYGLWKEKLIGIEQDVIATLVLIGTITILLSSRYFLGFGLPIDGILLKN